MHDHSTSTRIDVAARTQYEWGWLWLPLLMCLIFIGCRSKTVNLELKVNDLAPEFELQDQDGKKVSLKQLLSKRKYVAIVFYRSADW